ncbi:GNAT family N-acetyltransferase [candidate division WOR-3 bacterium]|nr:GNAT family N-acetyltransferase [candidate division WOR-3 bacterium]
MISQAIEEITEDDKTSLRLLQPEGWGDIVPAFEFYASKEFCRPVKLTEGSGIIAVGAAIIFENIAWLAHIIVRNDKRNKGLGRKIVDDLLEITSGCESVSLIATELGFPLYEKAGFREQTEYVFFEAEKQTEIQNSDSSIRQLTQEDIKDVLKMDTRITGEKRRELLLDKLSGGFVLKQGNSLRGFYLTELGEGLILADNPEAGIKLMEARMQSKKTAALPGENTEGIKFLIESGFVETKKAKRMILGKEFLWHPDKVWNRIGGNFG